MASTADPIFPNGKLIVKYAREVAANFEADIVFKAAGISDEALGGTNTNATMATITSRFTRCMVPTQ